MHMHLSSHKKAFAVRSGEINHVGSVYKICKTVRIYRERTLTVLYLPWEVMVWCYWAKMTFSKSEPHMEMSSQETRESISLHPQFMNSYIWAGQKKKKCQRGTSSTSDEKSNQDPAGWFRTGEGFQDKAAIKNEWLFATNTVAPESFMGHVMEKYVGTSDRGNPLPWQTSLEQQGLDVIESQQAL